jgi:serine/threonine-protein kinase
MSDIASDLLKLRVGALHQTQLGQAIAAKLPFRNRYQVLKVLGRGSFGITFLARDVALPGQMSCVIKLLSPKAVAPEHLLKVQRQFEQEARMLAKLGGHAQIPLLLDYFQLEGEFYLVQQYIPGATLAEEVTTSGSKSEAVVRQFLADVLPLIQYLHHNHVIHRDLKPENLIRCQDDGRLVLIDFGSVKEALGSVDDRLPAEPPSAQAVGTYGFAPPEQMMRQATFASDIYALGMTCLYLLSDKYPWDFEWDANTSEVCWQKAVKVSQSFATLLTRMTAVSLRDRYQSVAEVIADLQALPLPTQELDDTSQTPRQSPAPEQTETSGRLSPRYLSPAIRLATSIRDWRKRSQAPSEPPKDE